LYEWDERDPGKPRARQRCHALDAVRYVMTTPVSLPPPDSILTETEDPRVTRMWKSVRAVRKQEKQDREFNSLMDNLEDDPFEEDVLSVVEDFEVG
jgi:hypothetical protein